MNIGQEFIDNMMAMSEAKHGVEIDIRMAASRTLIAEASNAKMEELADELCIILRQNKEECYNNLLEWRDRIKSQLETAKPL